VLACVSALKSWGSRGLSRRALLARASCSAMKARGLSVKSVPDLDGALAGELRADILSKAELPGRIWCGSAIRVSEGGEEVGEGFDPDAKRGKVEIVCEM